MTLGAPLGFNEKEQVLPLAVRKKLSSNRSESGFTVKINCEDDQLPECSVPPSAPPDIFGCPASITKLLDVVILVSTAPDAVSVIVLLETEHIK